MAEDVDFIYESAEVMTLLIDRESITFAITAVYRPPNCSMQLLLSKINSFLNRFNNDDIILVGDFKITWIYYQALV